jgi:hypothetical protein
VRWIGVLVCVVACLAACALPGSSQGPTASQALAARLAAFAGARTVTMIGHVSYSDVNYPISLQVDDRGEASGTVELDHVLVATLLTAGKAYLRNSQYYAGHQLATGGQWVLETSGPVVDLLTKLADRKGLAAALRTAAGSDVSQRPGTAAGGVKTLRLGTIDVTATVPAAGGPPTRLVTGVDTPLSDGLAEVRLDLSDYGLAATIAAPQTFLDRSQPDTWPAFYSPAIGPDTPFSWDDCDRSGCTLNSSFKNTGGKVGSATATFYVVRAGATLASCVVAIPAASYNSIVRTGCRVNFVYDSPANANVQIHNPQ